MAKNPKFATIHLDRMPEGDRQLFLAVLEGNKRLNRGTSVSVPVDLIELSEDLEESSTEQVQNAEFKEIE